MQIKLTSNDLAQCPSPGPQGEGLPEALLARARHMSARAGHINALLDYEAVELLDPDGQVLALVEADPWAPEQRELAARLFALADSQDFIPKAAALKILQAELEDLLPDMHRNWLGLELAERLGCWQAYASLRERLPGAED